MNSEIVIKIVEITKSLFVKENSDLIRHFRNYISNRIHILNFREQCLLITHLFYMRHSLDKINVIDEIITSSKTIDDIKEFIPSYFKEAEIKEFFNNIHDIRSFSVILHIDFSILAKNFSHRHIKLINSFYNIETNNLVISLLKFHKKPEGYDNILLNNKELNEYFRKINKLHKMSTCELTSLSDSFDENCLIIEKALLPLTSDEIEKIKFSITEIGLVNLQKLFMIL